MINTARNRLAQADRLAAHSASQEEEAEHLRGRPLRHGRWPDLQRDLPSQASSPARHTRAMLQPAAVARLVVEWGYRRTDPTAATLAEILEEVVDEVERDHILDGKHRVARQRNLDRHIGDVLDGYNNRRIEPPLTKSLADLGSSPGHSAMDRLRRLELNVGASSDRSPNFGSAMLSITPTEFEALCGLVLGRILGQR